MHRLVLSSAVLASLPLVLSACGGASQASVSPRTAIETVYHVGATTSDSYHLNERVTVSVNSKPEATTSVVGNIYNDPTKPSSSYASFNTAYSAAGKNSGPLLILVKNNQTYFNASAFHLSGVKTTPGWKTMSMSTYLADQNSGSSSSITPVISMHAQSNLIRTLLQGAKFSSDGTVVVNGKTVNKYTASTTVAQFSSDISSTSGQLAISLARILSIYHLAGQITFTVETNNNDRLVAIDASFSASFKPAAGSSTSYQLGINIQEQYSHYGIAFSVHPPSGAKAITNFSGI
jgi:hypothetical protein